VTLMTCNIHGTDFDTETENDDSCPSCREEWIEKEVDKDDA